MKLKSKIQHLKSENAAIEILFIGAVETQILMKFQIKGYEGLKVKGLEMRYWQ